jgi:hypothetical protein
VPYAHEPGVCLRGPRKREDHGGRGARRRARLCPARQGHDQGDAARRAGRAARSGPGVVAAAGSGGHGVALGTRGSRAIGRHRGQLPSAPRLRAGEDPRSGRRSGGGLLFLPAGGGRTPVQRARAVPASGARDRHLAGHREDRVRRPGRNRPPGDGRHHGSCGHPSDRPRRAGSLNPRRPGWAPAPQKRRQQQRQL